MTLILSGTDGLSDVDGTAAAPAIRGTDANTGIFFPAADTIAFATGGTEDARFNSVGNLQTIGTISVGNATPSTSGAGITFPATQSASSDANTLDDYEEGTWTPVAAVGFTIVGATVASGSYTKIGNLVQVTGSLGGATTIASAGGNTRITGMPFTSVSNSVCAVAFVLDDISFLSSGLFNSTGTGIYVPTFGATAADLVFQFSYRV
jgi:hypothetical protein